MLHLWSHFNSLLHHAVQPYRFQDKFACIKLLVKSPDATPDKDSSKDDGYAPLHYALRKRFVAQFISSQIEAIIRLLI